MDKEGASFDTVLKEAQELGYAERNPEADVDCLLYTSREKIVASKHKMC